MDSIIKDLILGFAQESEIYTIYAKQCDTMRKIKFEFIDDDDEYILENIDAIYFKEKYSDGTIILPQLIEIGNELTMQLTREMLLVPGLARCELAFLKFLPNPNTGEILPPIIDDNGKIIGNYDILTTQTFNIYIEESAGVGDKIVGKSIDDLIAIILLGKQYAEDAEAWAIGKRGGINIPTTDPAYHNNALYWAKEAKSISDGIDGKFTLHEAVTGDEILAMNIDTLNAGDAYPTLTSFITNNTFSRGAGSTVPEGSLVYVVQGTPQKWDYLTPTLLGIKQITYSSDEPTNPSTGDVWIE